MSAAERAELEAELAEMGDLDELEAELAAPAPAVVYIYIGQSIMIYTMNIMHYARISVLTDDYLGLCRRPTTARKWRRSLRRRSSGTRRYKLKRRRQ